MNAPTGTHTSPSGRARGFDREAEDYLSRFCEHPSAKIMRATTHACFSRHLRRGQRLLDLCCGPGPDFPLWQELGLDFTGLDESAGMLAVARSQAPAASLVQLELAQLDQLEGPFDAVVANFGGLNTLLDPSACAAQLARLIRPGGLLFVNLMTRLPLPELAWGLLTGRHFLRRLRAGGVADLRVGEALVPTRYYHPGQFCAYFQAEFKLAAIQGLGIVLPPPYLPWRGRMAKPLGQLDSALGRLPLLNHCGDHALLLLSRC